MESAYRQKLSLILPPRELLHLAKKVVRKHFENKSTDPVMVASIALIESSGDVYAYRWEPHLNEASTGLCQTLLSTTVWLAKDMGYSAYGIPSDESLKDGVVSMYFCAAYLTWLSSYKGEIRSEEFTVRGYNGGPGGFELQATEHYWNKYVKAKETILACADEATNGSAPHSASPTLEYEVQPGEYLGMIAGKFGTSVKEILAVNPSLRDNPDSLQVGQVLEIPRPPQATVVEDSVSPPLTPPQQADVEDDVEETVQEHVKGSRFKPRELVALAEEVVDNHFQGLLDPMMPASIALVESAGDPTAYRWEAHINEASTGLCQTLLSTARWLANDLGYNYYGIPEDSSLEAPEVSMYFGCAYMKWLSTYAGEDRSEEFVVRGYNGGPKGIEREATVRYWEKYQVAKSSLSSLVAPQVEGAAAVQAHVVAPGEYLGKIASLYCVTVPELLAANPTLNPDIINIGQVIMIPGSEEVTSPPPSVTKPKRPTAHLTMEGETWTGLAARYRLPVETLLEANQRSSEDLSLQAGEMISIPSLDDVPVQELEDELKDEVLMFDSSDEIVVEDAEEEKEDDDDEEKHERHSSSSEYSSPNPNPPTRRRFGWVPGPIRFVGRGVGKVVRFTWRRGVPVVKVLILNNGEFLLKLLVKRLG